MHASPSSRTATLMADRLTRPLTAMHLPQNRPLRPFRIIPKASPLLAVGTAAMSLCCALMTPMARAAKTTTATTSGDWHAPATWNSGVPEAGDTVTVNSGVSVTLTNATPLMSAFTQNGTLTFQGWNTALNAGTVTINGTVKHAANLTAAVDALGLWIPSNRVYIVCTDLVLASGAKIDVVDAGYQGGWNNANGKGPGGTVGGGAPSGAGHGGEGGERGASSTAPNGAVYGVTNAPVDPGSGAGGWSGASGHGGHGGGAVRIDASGIVTINGTITANGGDSYNQSGVSGGGSGGSVYITCDRFAGTNGLISATGGAAGTHPWSPGGGAGGRIAVVYSPVSQSNQNLTARPTVQFAVNQGNANSGHLGAIGTLYFSDPQILNTTLQGGAISFGNAATAWTVHNLTVSNGLARFPAGFLLTITNDLSLLANGALRIDNGTGLTVGRDMILNTSGMDKYLPTRLFSDPLQPLTITVGRDLILTNSSALHVYAGTTNSASSANHGTRVDVSRDIIIHTNCWIHPVSHPTNGASIRWQAANLSIPTGNAGIDASGRGWQGAQPGAGDKHGWGPGRGLGGSSPQGGGYGGRGGNTTAPGNVYGVSNQPPVSAGSGAGAYDNAGAYYGGNGGGLIWVEAARKVTLNGTLRADGGTSYHISGVNSGGSGGGIYLTCGTISGSGALSAKGAIGGGHAVSAGGGGGRIQVWRVAGEPLTTDVAGGATPAATAGAAGSAFWGQIAAPGTAILIR